MNQLISPEARQVLTLGREKYWGFRVVEGYGTLTEETYKNGWWYLLNDSTHVEVARKRIEAIKNSGVRIQQVIVAHEAPKLLCAPKIERKVEIPWKDIGNATSLILRVAGMILTVFAYGVGFLMALAVGALIDPAVIVVLEDGTWVEVVRWYE